MSWAVLIAVAYLGSCEWGLRDRAPSSAPRLRQQLLPRDLVAPHQGRELVDVVALAVDRDGHGEILDLEFVDRFHAEILEPDHFAALARARDEIRSAADRHQVRRLTLGDRLRRIRPALGLADHRKQTLAPHHPRELVPPRRGGGARRADHILA